MSTNCKTPVRPVACTPACASFNKCDEQKRREAVNDALINAYGDNSLSAFDWRGLREIETVLQ